MNYENPLLNQPHQCPKFDHCSATLCPLDPQRSIRVIHRDDPICFFLLEVGKRGGEERISVGHSVAIAQVASEVFQEVMSTACPIKKRLLRASQTASRIRQIGQSIAISGAAA